MFLPQHQRLGGCGTATQFFVGTGEVLAAKSRPTDVPLDPETGHFGDVLPGQVSTDAAAKSPCPRPTSSVGAGSDDGKATDAVWDASGAAAAAAGDDDAER